MALQPQSPQFFNIALIIVLLLSPILPASAPQPHVVQGAQHSLASEAQPLAGDYRTAHPNQTAAEVRPAATLSAAEKFHLAASSHFVVINSSGIEPATITIEAGDAVTWHNATNTPVRLKRGTPPDDGNPPSGNNIFLPLISRGRASVVEAQQSTIPPAVTVVGAGDFDLQLAAGQDATYTFTAVETVSYYVERTGYPTGRVVVEPTRPTTLLTSSPANGEDGVATTRETIIEFTRPIQAAGVTAANFTARFGSRLLNARLQHSADGKRVTLFYTSPLPASARVQVTINSAAITDINGQTVDGNGDGQPGGTTTIEFDTLSVTVVPGTAVCGRVFASELAADGNTSVNVPLQGATITVDGMESTLRTVTNNEGNFCLDPAPAGEFFVHIDGRTATNGVPNGAYYPFVGKAWHAVVGKQSSVGNIYLPLVVPGTLQAVSNTQDTRIGFAPSIQQKFPAFADVEIYVPANSLYRDDGTRGGKVGIAPVPPDRLPGELPAGLNFPLVITVQTDGATNFDKPAPICFPNLPDPETKAVLIAGAKSALWSFNHDTGRFEVVGPMTVSNDGTLVCTDPGVGLPAPGWHGSQPGTPATGPANPLPPAPAPTPLPEMCSDIEYPDWVDVGLTATNCLKDFFKLGKFLDVLIDLTQTVRDLYKEVVKLAEDAKAGQMGDAAIRTAVLLIRGNLRTMKITADALSDQTIGKIRAAIGCINAGAALLNDTCQSIAGIPAECLNFIEKNLVKSYCNNLHTELTNALTFLERGIDLVSNGLKDAAFQAIEDVLDSILIYLDSTQHQIYASQHTGGTPDPELIKLLDQLVTSVSPLGISADDVIGIKDAVEVVGEYSADLGDAAIALNGPIRNGYLVVTYEDVIQRLRSDANGRYAFFLSPQSIFAVSAFDPATGTCGTYGNRAASAGRPTEIHGPMLTECTGSDEDRDQLQQEAEYIIGTDPNKVDTDNDGIPDGTEVQNGTDPLDGIAAQTGVVGAADTPGTALDVCVDNNLAAVADGDAGVALFNVFDGLRPTLVAQVDTPGLAQAITCSDGLVAVADKDAGVALIDTRNPANATIRHQVALNGAAQAVAIVNGLVYAGSATGQLAVMDSSSGTILGTVSLGEAIDEIAVANDYLYVLTRSALVLYALWDGGLAEVGRTLVDGRVSPLEFGRKLFVGGGRAYVGHFTGYTVIDVSNPAAPQLQGAPPTTQAAIHGLASTGSGELVAVTSFSGASTLAVSLYDDSNPNDVTKFLTSYNTPGDPRGVALYNGLAYIADSTAGLQVVNYLSYDSGRTAPTLTLTNSFSGDRAEENKATRVTATATDDVQVRQVEFYRDGALAATDGSYPFEHRFVTPRMTNQPSFRLRVRAVDTGGNERWTNEQTITLVTDATPPRVLRYTPSTGANPADTVRSLSVTFSEAINQSTLTAANFNVRAAGPDNLLGTGDDTPLTGGALAFNAETATASLTFGAALPAGIYRGTVTAAISDLAGNRLTAPATWDFGVGQRLPLGTVITGEISTPGEQDVYTFVATPNQRVYFDDQNASRPNYFYWKVVDSSGAQIFSDSLDESDPGVYYLERGGNYTLTVWGYQQTTGSYRFQLRSTPPDKFAITIGDVVATGQPGAGAGTIEIPGNVDQYTFTATTNQRVYFDDQNASRPNYFYWNLYDSSGTRIFQDDLDDSDPGVYILEKGGTYTLNVWSYTNTAGTYQFQLRSNPPDQFAINIGAIVSDGQPGAGAGNIEIPGNVDQYTFTATPNQRVYFDDQNASRPNYFYWNLYDSSGTRIFQDDLDGSDPGVYALAKGGTYTLNVWSYPNTAGTYQFQLRSNPPDQFTITIGDIVKDGQPGAGAGNIEIPGNLDQYTFTATPNQRVYFDDQNASRANYFYWNLYDSSGTRIFQDDLDDSDPGVYILEKGGTYTINVWSYTNTAGTYQFQLRSNPPDQFAIAIGDIIQNNQPSAGAGNIEIPGNVDQYTFTATPNQRVYFDDQNASRPNYFYWNLYDSSGTRIFQDDLDDSDPGVYLLAKGGTYTINVWSYPNTAGTYQFQLRSNPPDRFTINVGDTVSDGQPGAGAGKIELPGNFDQYTFTATPGQSIYFDDQNASRPGYFYWELHDASGRRIFQDTLNNTDPGAYTLALGGVYTITAWAYVNNAGTYQFQIRTPTVTDAMAEKDTLTVAGNEEVTPLMQATHEPEGEEKIYLPLVQDE